MFLKYSVYILTPKNHQTVMTTTKNLYTFTKKNINYVKLPCEGSHEYNQRGETIGKTLQKQRIYDKYWYAIEVAATKREDRQLVHKNTTGKTDESGRTRGVLI